MTLCDKDCIPCCDFCIHVIHEEWDDQETGSHIRGGPVGCKLHTDQEHQNIAEGCGYCNDYYCRNAWKEANKNGRMDS